VGLQREICETEVGAVKNILGREKEKQTCGETCDACRSVSFGIQIYRLTYSVCHGFTRDDFC
jgi:hypothetical protein